MDQETVSELESRIAQAIAEALADARTDLGEIPLPSAQTLHLMAKGAVTVYEAAVAEEE